MSRFLQNVGLGLGLLATACGGKMVKVDSAPVAAAAGEARRAVDAVEKAKAEAKERAEVVKGLIAQLRSEIDIAKAGVDRVCTAAINDGVSGLNDVCPAAPAAEAPAAEAPAAPAAPAAEAPKSEVVKELTFEVDEFINQAGVKVVNSTLLQQAVQANNLQSLTYSDGNFVVGFNDTKYTIPYPGIGTFNVRLLDDGKAKATKSTSK